MMEFNVSHWSQIEVFQHGCNGVIGMLVKIVFIFHIQFTYSTVCTLYPKAKDMKVTGQVVKYFGISLSHIHRRAFKHTARTL